MNPIFNVKKMFLDSAKVQRLMDKKTSTAFKKYGGLVRKVAQRSMRTRKGSSPAGMPPYAHTKKLLKKMLFYSYDEQNKSVVIGPVRLGKAKIGVPRLHEHGGVYTVMNKRGKIINRHYPERKYMQPAHETSIAKLPSYFK